MLRHARGDILDTAAMRASARGWGEEGFACAAVATMMMSKATTSMPVAMAMAPGLVYTLRTEGCAALH